MAAADNFLWFCRDFLRLFFTAPCILRYRSLMTVAFPASAASAAVKVAAIPVFLAAGNRRACLHEAVPRLCVAASANRAHRDPAARD